MDASAFEQVYGAFGDFHAYFGPLFGRREARDHSRHYLQALLVQSGERRNAENLSETTPASARVMQRFLTESPWDDDAVIGRLQEHLSPRLGHPEAVWVLDGSNFPKQGRKSAGQMAEAWRKWTGFGRFQKKQERFPKSQILKGVLPFFGKCHPLRKTLSLADKYSAQARLSLTFQARSVESDKWPIITF